MTRFFNAQENANMESLPSVKLEKSRNFKLNSKKIFLIYLIFFN